MNRDPKLKKLLSQLGVRCLGTEYWPVIEDEYIKFMADTGDVRVETRQAKDFERWLKANKIRYNKITYRSFEIQKRSIKKWEKILDEIG